MIKRILIGITVITLVYFSYYTVSRFLVLGNNVHKLKFPEKKETYEDIFHLSTEDNGEWWTFYPYNKVPFSVFRKTDVEFLIFKLEGLRNTGILAKQIEVKFQDFQFKDQLVLNSSFQTKNESFGLVESAKKHHGERLQLYIDGKLVKKIERADFMAITLFYNKILAKYDEEKEPEFILRKKVKNTFSELPLHILLKKNVNDRFLLFVFPANKTPLTDEELLGLISH